MFKQEIYKGIEDGKGVYETLELGVGTTFFVGSKDYQVMSDIWEYGQYAIYWNGTELKTADWIKEGKADASEEIVAEARKWVFQKVYDREYSKRLNEAKSAANELSRGCIAKVVKGRKFPIGLTGKVVGFSESQWGRSVGIATSDVMIEVERNGRKFQNHKDVAWVAIKNVERADKPNIDLKAIEEKARDVAEYHMNKSSWWQLY